MTQTAIQSFHIARFEFKRDRIVGDSQVQADRITLVTLELRDGAGRTGLGLVQVMFRPAPAEAELTRVFADEVWADLEGAQPAGLAHQVRRVRGGNRRGLSIPFEEAIQQAVWDLFAQQMDMPLWKLLGARANRGVPVYASGLDFHLSDRDYTELFGRAAARGYRGFKVKVGHPDLERDRHRLDLLARAVGHDRPVMIDANEAWTARETLVALEAFARDGHRIYWAEDPIPRDDVDGLRMLRAANVTRINAGEYLDLSGKRKLIEARACDVLNVHGQVGDVMRAGWLAEEANVEVAFGNSIMEIGVNMALALPGVRWLEYSFQNFEHLLERPYPIVDGLIRGHDTPGHGLALSAEARQRWRTPEPLAEDALETPAFIRHAAA